MFKGSLGFVCTLISLMMTAGLVSGAFHGVGDAETHKFSPKVEFFTWGFEDYDLPVSDFRLNFPFNATIIKVAGYISASELPNADPEGKKRGYVRQNLLSCRCHDPRFTREKTDVKISKFY